MRIMKSLHSDSYIEFVRNWKPILSKCCVTWLCEFFSLHWFYIIFFGKKKERKYQDDQILNGSVFYLRLMFTENDKKPMTLTFNKHQSVEQFATDFFLFTSKIFGKWKQHVFFPQIMSDKQIKRERHENRLRLLPFIIIHGSLLFLCYYFLSIFLHKTNKRQFIFALHKRW